MTGAVVYVIMANDFPHLVKSTRQKAKRYVDKANKDDVVRAIFDRRSRIHYRYYEATVDGGPIR
jgi:hypothetical protein